MDTRPNISESHSEIGTRVPFCIAAGRSDDGVFSIKLNPNGRTLSGFITDRNQLDGRPLDVSELRNGTFVYTGHEWLPNDDEAQLQEAQEDEGREKEEKMPREGGKGGHGSRRHRRLQGRPGRWHVTEISAEGAPIRRSFFGDTEWPVVASVLFRTLLATRAPAVLLASVWPCS